MFACVCFLTIPVALQSEYWKAQSEEQAQLIQLLQEQIEYERTRSEDLEAGREVDARAARGVYKAFF